MGTVRGMAPTIAQQAVFPDADAADFVTDAFLSCALTLIIITCVFL